MNLTDLESVLFLTVGVLLWRLSIVKAEVRTLRGMANRYAEALIAIGNGTGRVRQRTDGTYYFEGKTNEASK